MQLIAEPQMAGQIVKCPACNAKVQVPLAPEGDDGHGSAAGTGAHSSTRTFRAVWKEQDPTNPNALLSLGIGLGITVIWFAIIYFFQAPAGKVSSEFTTGETLANLFYKHFSVSFANTLFFCWAAAICYLKLLKLRHQRRAMLLDVLPMELGEQISVKNVGVFIDHVYGLPETLRDSLMVNRIRKALEFFEARQNVADVSSLMSSQSAIDGSRIIGSYILVRAFLWAIPLLGFIGTVVGLSHAISGMSFSNVEDVSKIVGSINSVTSGLGTAFDATLLGLIFAVLLNFPLNSLAKHEEEALNDIDAFCNEVLLPRLDDGAAAAAQEKGAQASMPGNMEAVAEIMVRAVHSAQSEFLTDLNALSTRMLDYANALEFRNEQYQSAALQHLADQMNAVDARAREHFDLVRQQQDEVMQNFSRGIAGLEQATQEVFASMVQGQNQVVGEFTHRLGAISEGVEKTVASSVEAANRAVQGVGENISKLEAHSRNQESALNKVQQDASALLCERVDKMAQDFASQISKTVSNLEDSTRGALEAMVKNQSGVVGEFSQKLSALSSGMEGALSASVDASQKAVSGMGEHISRLESTSRAYQEAVQKAQEEAVKLFSEKVKTSSGDLAANLNASVQLTQQTISGIESGVRSLNAVLEKLGNQQVVVQQVQKKGWFSRG